MQHHIAGAHLPGLIERARQQIAVLYKAEHPGRHTHFMQIKRRIGLTIDRIQRKLQRFIQRDRVGHG